MLDATQIRELATANSAQSLWAALLWQQGFNNLHGETVIKDLVRHSNQWASFVFVCPIYTPDPSGLALKNLIRVLQELAEYRWLISTQSESLTPYQADTLYILAQNKNSTRSTLLDLGKKWQADSIEVIDGERGNYSQRLQPQLKARLIDSIHSPQRAKKQSGVVISYWWDRSDE